MGECLDDWQGCRKGSNTLAGPKLALASVGLQQNTPWSEGTSEHSSEPKETLVRAMPPEQSAASLDRLAIPPRTLAATSAKTLRCSVVCVMISSISIAFLLTLYHLVVYLVKYTMIQELHGRTPQKRIEIIWVL